MLLTPNSSEERSWSMRGTRDLAGQRDAQHLVVLEREGQVHARQPVGVGLAVLDRQAVLPGRLGAIPVERVRGLVDVLDLHAEVAAHADIAPGGVDVGLEPAGGDLLVRPSRPSRPGRTHPSWDRRSCSAATAPGTSQAGIMPTPAKPRSTSPYWNSRADRGDALAAEVDVALGLALFLLAVGVVEAEVEAAEGAVRARRGQVGVELEAGQLIDHGRGLAVARAVDGAGEEQVAPGLE